MFLIFYYFIYLHSLFFKKYLYMVIPKIFEQIKIFKNIIYFLLKQLFFTGKNKNLEQHLLVVTYNYSRKHF